MRKEVMTASVCALMVALSSFVVLIPDLSAEDDPLPSSFDQRDYGIVTPPKYQNPWDTCWAFGGAGAAETAILNAMGKTYDETGLDLSEKHIAYYADTPVYAPVTTTQEGEGLHLLPEGPNMPYIKGGLSYYFAQLFSTGAGPVMEETCPYHGKNSLTMSGFYQDHDLADKYVRTEYADLEEELSFYTEEERERLFNGWIEKGYVFPEGVDAENFTFDDFVEAEIGFQLKRYQEQDMYSEFDDWSMDIGGHNQSMGYSMTEANRLKETRIIDDGKWTGVDWDAVNEVKSELAELKGVVTIFNSSSPAYNNEYGTYYNISDIATHTVQVIGWDDSIPKELFSYKAGDVQFTPEGDGGWLCKNSYASETVGYVIEGRTYYNDFGIKDETGKGTGYFWLSYYDRSTTGFESMTFSEKKYDESMYTYYVHDFLPDLNNYFWTSDEPVSIANVFTAEGESKIERITVSSRGYDSDVNVKVYLDPNDGRPDSGELVYETTAHYDYAGIHVIFPGNDIKLGKGQTFSIVMEERSPDGKYLYGLNSHLNKESGAVGGIYGVSVINRGESYICQEDSWKDLVDAVGDLNSQYPRMTMDNFSIKVFTVGSATEDNGHLYAGILVVIIALGAAVAIFLRRRIMQS